uniref:dihydropteroate synthase n=1 Tax=Candidatus Aschnera chinzeii TaxID=1485666 RepID=A0AAT9G587_9ENTR|nr:MAG: dihydropteroate synthase [Candidatus Aschnera chinzeii]
MTPDSFYDGGKYCNHNKAIKYVNNMIINGAKIVDIGGESTRPGSIPISEQEELDRVIPIIEKIHTRFDILISIDTSKAIVMKEAEKAGAHIINDIRSLQEPNALETAAQSNLPICIMHMIGTPQTMQQKIPKYKNIISDIKNYLKQQIKRCELAGINKNRLIIDPGFGFSKNVIHNYQLLSNLYQLKTLQLPILIGISRKSMIGNILKIPANERLIGSIACATIAAMQLINIIRTHDIKETYQAIKIAHTVISNQKNYKNE